MTLNPKYIKALSNIRKSINEFENQLDQFQEMYTSTGVFEKTQKKLLNCQIRLLEVEQRLSSLQNEVCGVKDNIYLKPYRYQRLHKMLLSKKVESYTISKKGLSLKFSLNDPINDEDETLSRQLQVSLSRLLPSLWQDFIIEQKSLTLKFHNLHDWTQADKVLSHFLERKSGWFTSFFSSLICRKGTTKPEPNWKEMC